MFSHRTDNSYSCVLVHMFGWLQKWPAYNVCVCFIWSFVACDFCWSVFVNHACKYSPKINMLTAVLYELSYETGIHWLIGVTCYETGIHCNFSKYKQKVSIQIGSLKQSLVHWWASGDVDWAPISRKEGQPVFTANSYLNKSMDGT